MKRIRVLVVDDHVLVRSGILRILSAYRDIEVVGEADNGEIAVKLAAEYKPDLVLMDVDMPGQGGVAAAKAITTASHHVRVLMLTGYPEYVVHALQAGATGYLLKEASSDDLIAAVRRSAEGIGVLDPGVHTRVIGRVQAQDNVEPPNAIIESPLTSRETDLIRLAARGRSNRQIGDELALAETTVKTYMSTIMSKLGAANRTEAVNIAREHRYI